MNRPFFPATGRELSLPVVFRAPISRLGSRVATAQRGSLVWFGNAPLARHEAHALFRHGACAKAALGAPSSSPMAWFPVGKFAYMTGRLFRKALRL
jgi:hypothetical protein